MSKRKTWRREDGVTFVVPPGAAIEERKVNGDQVARVVVREFLTQNVHEVELLRRDGWTILFIAQRAFLGGYAYDVLVERTETET